MDFEDIPKDAETIQNLLQTMDAKKYDPRVVEQLMNFMYRYTSEVLQDAEAVSTRSGGAQGEVGAQDVALAIQMRAKNSFVPPPPQRDLSKLAELRNTAPLPELRTRHGIRIPPEGECLLNPGFQLPPTPAVRLLPDQQQMPAGAPSRQVEAAAPRELPININEPSNGWQPQPDAPAEEWPQS